MFDMGPYYLTALVSLLGPVVRICGSAKKGQEERTITSEPLNGTKIKVEVPTHITGVLDFKDGTVGTIITSFDVWSSTMPFIEIYGTEGTMQVPDPNYFRGEIKIKRFREEQWTIIPNEKGWKGTLLSEADAAGDAALAEIAKSNDPDNKEAWHRANNLRGIGITEMAMAIEENRPHRASSEMTFHVLDIMHCIHDASTSGKYCRVKSTCDKPLSFL
jgi:predicted dehydrogenase